MKTRLPKICLLLTAVLLVFVGCGKKEDTQMSSEMNGSVSIQQLDENKVSSGLGSEVVSESSSSEDAAETETEEPVVLDILRNIKVEAGTKELVAEDFFENYDGQVATVVQPLTEDELATAGSMYYILVDYMGYECDVLVEIVDTTAPVLEGVADLEIELGESVSYKKNIVTSDNSNDKLTLEIDNSAVNIEKPGVYDVIYKLSDLSGNVTTATATLTVIEPGTIHEEDVKPLAEKVIKQVVPKDADKYETARSLYLWCKWNIKYLHTSGDRSSIWSGAYEGLHDHAGDCYAFYATYAVLLTYCDIPNECVARVGGTSNHWWNLVNTGDGWYHCDTSPRRLGDEGYTCWMQTDAQVLAYTETYPEHPNYYVFDDTDLPERETKIIAGYSPEGIIKKFTRE